MGQHQSFKELHDDRCQSDRPVVGQSCDGGFDDGGVFEAGRDLTELQESVEDLRVVYAEGLDWHTRLHKS